MSALPLAPPRDAVIDVRDLGVRVNDTDLVADVSFSIRRGERVGLIGESGSGKSLTGLSLMGLLPEDLVASGSVRLSGSDLEVVGAADAALSRVRGRDVAMVFQEPMTALNPTMRVGDQVAEALLIHHTVPDRRTAQQGTVDLLEQVRLPEPAETARAYPHQLSGGQRQRVVLAIALANDPALLVCDEPTTALDVTVQAQIMKLLQELQEERKMGLILITHDLGVVADVADRIAVMYAGRIVERGDIFEIYRQPAHPYTKGLLDSIPRLDQKGQTLAAIGGLPPSLTAIPVGCPFNPRCHYAEDVCRQDPPPALREVIYGRFSACHFSELLLEGSPELKVTQTVEDVERAVEFEGHPAGGVDGQNDPTGARE
jgi:oligopeptide transport system ATP-binding protein